MSKFKAGDKVRIIKATNKSALYSNLIGNVYTLLYKVTDTIQVGSWAVQEEVDWFIREDDIELEKESISKFLKENKWFIRTGSVEKSELVQEWLFEHGYGWVIGKNSVSDFKEKYLTNTSDSGELSKYIMHGNSDKTNAKEITLEFETVVKSVKLPEAPKKTEQQLRIEELETTIAQASAQIKQLKEGV